MATVLEIATAHFTAQQASYLGTVTVSEWLDNAVPVELDISHATQADIIAIQSGRNRLGAQGAIIWTVMRRCWRDDARVFADTDEQTLLNSVDPVVLKSIADAIVALES